MHHISQTYSTLFIALLCLSTTPVQAETDTRHKANDQQQLRSILQELDQVTQQRQQQKMRLETLSWKLECNWTLIRAWETCGQLHANDPDGHLQCSALAKQNAEQCLDKTGKEK